MLVLSRRLGEEIIIGDNIRLAVVAVHGNHVRLGLTAPQDVSIRREELSRRAKDLGTISAGTEAKKPTASKQELFDRGWTNSAIRDFLGKPDGFCENPIYRNGPPTYLFSMKRVLEVESSQAFIDWQAKVAVRKAGSKKGLLTKQTRKIRRQAMTKQQIMDNLTMRFPDADPKQLRRFVDSGWDGDVNVDGLKVIAEAWAESNY
jgi:carbon storage regulator